MNDKEIESIIEANNKANRFFKSRPFLRFYFKVTGEYELRLRMVKLNFHRLEINKRLK